MQLLTFLTRAASLLALATATQCTPASSGWPTTEWRVANVTSDTLYVTVRYPLDSVALPATEFATARNELRVDSAGQVQLYGYYHPFFQRFTHHHGQGYMVQNTQNILYYAELNFRHNSSPAREPRVDKVHGIIRYRVPPHGGQQLLLTETDTTAAAVQAAPFLAELSLQAGRTRRAVLPGLPRRFVFRPQPTGREHDHAPRFCFQLTVGPGLALNPANQASH